MLLNIFPRKSVVFFLLFHELLLVLAKSNSIVTSKGPIIGQEVRTSNVSYATYFGIPYAQVDDNNRFGKTLPYPTFTTPFVASDPNILCPQVILREGGILQCLRLNIYVPLPVHPGTPVFVWFHGGGLAFGSAGEYNATHLVQEGVIVVTANYRLGPYGFLCTSDIKNQGLEDMKTALKWIKKEIHAFGGDCNKVTIAGESWGGSAVDYLLYDDDAEFNQAIIQSGPRFSYAVSSREDTEILLRLATNLGHVTSNFTDALNFLNKANPIDVMRAYNSFDYVFGICEKRGDFELNLNAKYARRIKNTPIMIGYTSKETFEDIASKPDSYYVTVEDEFFNSLGKVFDLKNETLRNITNKVWKFYLGEKPISKDAMLEIIDLSSDFQENYGTERSVTNFLKLQNPKVYKYVFSYIGESPYKNVTGVGAYHTQELPLLFDWWTKLKTEEEFKMRRWLVKLWMNFVKYGDPTPNHGDHGWLPTDLATRSYLNIDVESEMRNHAYKQRMAFWEKLWSDYGQYRK